MPAQISSNTKVIMHSEPFFSVILPTYNREKMLPNAIRSVIAQEFSEWELIVIDDGSTDNTNKIVADFQDARIMYIYQENAERSAARNNGIRHARGKYIAFLDDDDEYLPVHLISLHEFINAKNQPVAMIFTDFMWNGIPDDANADEMLLVKNPVEYFLNTPVGTPRVCLHSKILMEFHFDETVHFGEDIFLWIPVSIKYPVVHLEKTTVNCSKHDARSVNLANPTFPPIIPNLRSLFLRYNGTGLISKRIKKTVLSSFYYRKAKYHYLKKSFLAMIRCLLLSFYHQPRNRQNKAKLYLVKSYLFGPIISSFDW
jgi:glycosyltransferase involved in cell wall biosynthesis